MNASIPDRCECTYRKGFGQGSVACGETLKYDGPDGVIHLVMWHSYRARYIGPECATSGRAGEAVREQFFAMYGKDWAKKYTVHVDNPEEERREAISRARFRWTLTETAPQRVNGLVRQDGSAVHDVVGLGYIPTPSVRRTR